MLQLRELDRLDQDPSTRAVCQKVIFIRFAVLKLWRVFEQSALLYLIELYRNKSPIIHQEEFSLLSR